MDISTMNIGEISYWITSSLLRYPLFVVYCCIRINICVVHICDIEYSWSMLVCHIVNCSSI